MARFNVSRTAGNNFPLDSSSRSSVHTRPGPGSRYSGFQCDHTTHCHRKTAIATAATLGHAADHTRRTLVVRGSLVSSRASRPASSLVRFSGVASTGMAGDLLAQPVGDLPGQPGHLGRVDASRSLDVDGELLDDAPWTRGQQHDAISKTR